MKPERKKTLLDIVALEIEAAEKSAEAARQVAVEYADSSPSQSGERKAYEAVADLAETKLQKLKLLLHEIEATSNEVAQTVQPVCFIELDYGDEENAECYLANNAMWVSNFTLITPQSSMGAAALGKKKGDRITFHPSEDKKREVSCTIANLE